MTSFDDRALESPGRALSQRHAFELAVFHIAWRAVRELMQWMITETFERREAPSAVSIQVMWGAQVTNALERERLPQELDELVLPLLLEDSTPDLVYTAATDAMTFAVSQALDDEALLELLEGVFDTRRQNALVAAGWDDVLLPTGKLSVVDALLDTTPSGVTAELPSWLPTPSDRWGHQAAAMSRGIATRMNATLTQRRFREKGTTFKKWVSRRDARVRFSHGHADGQVVRVEEPFSVGGSLLMHPGDRAGALEEIMGCRCVMVAAPRGK